MPIKKIIEWLGFREQIHTAPGVHARFLLKYSDMIIGTLSADDGRWKFEYSPEFRQQDSLRPIVEFPDVENVYQSDDLWEFFASRIPSPKQAEVEEILKREQIDEDDVIRLLQRFGKKTITNPFELEAVA